MPTASSDADLHAPAHQDASETPCSTDMLSRLGVEGNRFAPPYLENCNSAVLRYMIH